MGTARYTPAALPVIRKNVDQRRMAIWSVLTYPVTDHEGDFVVPTGIDWTLHKADPRNNLEHLRWNRTGTDWGLPGEPGITDRMVAVASAVDPDTGEYSVRLTKFPDHPEIGPVPVGGSFFDPGNRLSSQVFALADRDILPAVSMEFTLRPGRFKAIGPNLLGENRPAYRVEECDGLTIAHCAVPVNPGAMVLTKSVTPLVEAAIRFAQTGRVGSEAAHPLLLKAFRRRFPATKSTAVVGGFVPPARKAMPSDTELAPAYPAPDAEPEAAEPEPAAGGSTPTVQALYQLAQSLTDLKGQVEEMLAGSEHVKGKKFATKLLADLDGTVEDATEMAARIEAELGGKGSEDEPAEEPEPDVAEDDTEPGDDGVLKAIRRRPAVFKAIRRFTLAEFRKAEPVTPEPAADDLAAQLEALQRSDPAAYDRVALRAVRKLARR